MNDDTTNAAAQTDVPLSVDLDGTLIRTDMMWESLVILLRKNPFRIFSVLLWWMRGRANLKQQLGRRVQVDAATLPYNEALLTFIRAEKQRGRRLILATASDRSMVQPVFDHVGLFDELLASDGKTNLRGAAKVKLLTELYGERGFDYAGNSSVDLPVWAGSREAIVVNCRRELVDRAAQQTKLGPTFIEGYSRLFQLKRILHGLFIESGYLVAIIAGLLLSAAFPKIGIAGFAWIAPAIILFATRGKSGADAFRVGYVAGLTTWLASLYWLLLIPVTGYPILGWLALCAFLGLFSGTWVWVVSVLPYNTWWRRTAWALSGAAAWVALEMIRARILSGFPWIPLGASQFKLLPLIQIASVAGVYGVSFLVVWTSLSLFSAVNAILRRPTARYAWAADVLLPMLVILGVFFFGMDRLREPDTTGRPLRVTSIQPSIPQTMIWNTDENETRFQRLMALTEQALTNETDLLIWPEAALPEFNDANYAAITNLVAAHGVWMIFGADDVEERPGARGADRYDFYNASFLFGPDGQYVARYHKQKLVIFGEYIPLVRWLPFVKWFTPITGGFTAGERVVHYEVAHAKTATLICFEDVFPHVARDYVDDDTDFLINLTNDGWFGEGSEQMQHAATAVFRCVENGVPLVRSCNNGVTCWIDSKGRMREILLDEDGRIYGAGALTMDIPTLAPDEKRAQTFYNRHGDFFGWVCVGWAGLVCLVNLLKRSRSRLENTR